VEADTPSTRAAFGPEPPLELAKLDIRGVADAIERLLADEQLRAHHRDAGIDFAQLHTWDDAAESVEAGLREALRLAAE
jgi:glycosyltransferase involved in cell wall biosynthesis